MSGKVAIVTGATSGMGRATALKFASEGAKAVVLVARTTDKLEEVAGEIAALEGTGTLTAVVTGDVSLESTAREMVETALATFGSVDAAFVNAGMFAMAKFADVKDADYDAMMNLNVRSIVWAFKYLLPAMKGNANGGSIVVNTSCMGSYARVNFAGSGLYSASKAAADMLVRYAAVEAATDNAEGTRATRVNAIAPGVVATNIGGMSQEQSDGFGASTQLVGRAGRADEIANFVAFLSSDDASFMTGSVCVVDGGWALKA